MDNIRLILWFALLGTLWLSYSQWVEDYSSEPQPQSPPGGSVETLPQINPVAEADLPARTPADAPPEGRGRDAGDSVGGRGAFGPTFSMCS